MQRGSGPTPTPTPTPTHARTLAVLACSPSFSAAQSSADWHSPATSALSLSSRCAQRGSLSADKKPCGSGGGEEG